MPCGETCVASVTISPALARCAYRGVERGRHVARTGAVARHRRHHDAVGQFSGPRRKGEKNRCWSFEYFVEAAALLWSMSLSKCMPLFLTTGGQRAASGLMKAANSAGVGRPINSDGFGPGLDGGLVEDFCALGRELVDHGGGVPCGATRPCQTARSPRSTPVACNNDGSFGSGANGRLSSLASARRLPDLNERELGRGAVEYKIGAPGQNALRHFGAAVVRDQHGVDRPHR